MSQSGNAGSSAAPRHSMSFVRTVGSFPYQIAEFFPDEQAAVGAECVDIAQRMMQSVAETVRCVLQPCAYLPAPLCYSVDEIPNFSSTAVYSCCD
eukprot:SAG22_NODE_2612_length_2381_cov_2.086766_4_plen_95_part_00